MAKVDVELPDALQEWVESRVETGFYADAGDFIRDLVRQNQRSTLRGGSTLDDLLAEGIADLKAGRVHGIEEVFAEVYAIIDEEEAKQAAE